MSGQLAEEVPGGPDYKCADALGSGTLECAQISSSLKGEGRVGRAAIFLG